MGSPLLITLNPGVGREEGSAPLAGVLVDLPCDEECAGSVPPVLAVCLHPQQSLALGISLLFQALLIFFEGLHGKGNTHQGGPGDTAGAPRLGEIQGLPKTAAASRSSVPGTWGTDGEQMAPVLGK